MVSIFLENRKEDKMKKFRSYVVTIACIFLLMFSSGCAAVAIGALAGIGAATVLNEMADDDEDNNKEVHHHYHTEK